jgi:hypothetical protein
MGDVEKVEIFEDGEVIDWYYKVIDVDYDWWGYPIIETKRQFFWYYYEQIVQKAHKYDRYKRSNRCCRSY